ncbi:MAG: hypothetical protein E7612_08305 [Ruminococcaceae bacterium]|nr:hypothetical protein [Oscillospiraceae bacterium]
MKKKSDLFGIYLPIYLITALASVVLRTVSLFLHYDFDTYYFSEKTLIGISDGILICSAVFMLSYIFFSAENLKLIPNFTSPATYVPTGITSVAIIFMTFSLFSKSADTFNYITDLKNYGTPSALSQISTQRILLIMLIATSFFAILSTIHFVTTALIEQRSNAKRANLGICTVVFLSLYSLYLYFSNDLPINSPNKALDQMAYLFSAVFFLYETRLSFGRERWRHYIAFGFIASAISAYAAIPSVILYFATGKTTSNSVYELALTLALFIFITSRLFLTSNLIENKESKTALAIISASELRDREINPIPEKPEIIDIEGESLLPVDETDGNQLTIADIGESFEAFDSPINEETDTEEMKDETEENNGTSEN